MINLVKHKKKTTPERIEKLKKAREEFIKALKKIGGTDG